MAKPNIAFIGKAGAGKTTCAEILAKQYGYERLSLAGPLKDIAVQIWGTAALVDRPKLQGLGMAVRQLDPEAWVNLLLRDIELRPGVPMAIDDVRFPNEYWALRGAGFKIVRVVAPAEKRADRLRANGKWTGEEDLGHISETSLPGDDFPSDGLLENIDVEAMAENLHTMIYNWRGADLA